MIIREIDDTLCRCVIKEEKEKAVFSFGFILSDVVVSNSQYAHSRDAIKRTNVQFWPSAAASLILAESEHRKHLLKQREEEDTLTN